MAYRSLLEDQPEGSQEPILPGSPQQQPAQQAGYKSLLEDEQNSATQQTQAANDSLVDWADVGKSAAISIPKGIIQGAGTIGDIQHLGETGATWLIGKEGVEEERKKGSLASKYLFPEPDSRTFPTGDEIKKKVEGYTGEFYEPKSTTGKYVQSAGEFASNPLSYLGGGGWVAKLLKSLSAGVTSEAGGQAGSMISPEAEAAGRVVGAVLAPGALRAPKQKSPSTEDLIKASKEDYKIAMEGIPIKIKPQALHDVADDIEKELLRQGFRPRNQREAFDALKEFKQTHPYGDANLADVESIRKVFNNVSHESGKAASVAIEKIDKFLDGISHNPHVSSPMPGAMDTAVKVLKDARGNHSMALTAQVLEKAVENKHLLTVTSGSGANVENNLRKAAASVLRNRGALRNYSPEEIAALREVAEGTMLANTARRVGKFNPTGAVSSSAALFIGRMLGGKWGEAALPIAGYLGDNLARKLAQKKMDRVMDDVRLRSPLGKTYPRVSSPSMENALTAARRAVVGAESE